MNEIASVVIFAAIIVVIICSIIALVDAIIHSVRRKVVLSMNREAAKYDLSGWFVLIDVKRRVVGLYNDQHSVSHDTIRIGKDVLNMIKDSDVTRLTIGDFRKLNVEIPRFSYRVLYEYKVPHETPVMMY